MGKKDLVVTHEYIPWLVSSKHCGFPNVGEMPEGITPEGLLNNIMESISDGVSKHKSGSFFEEEKSSSVSAQFNRLFGRQKPVHHCLGGGKRRGFFY